jgi:hypothetical protein
MTSRLALSLALVIPCACFAQPPKGDDPPAKDLPKGAFAGRVGEARAKLVKENGGNEASEKAVAAGLKWLAAQQKEDGGWEFDQGSKEERAAATGFALLAFLGAGETHKDRKAKHKDVVKDGLESLKKACPVAGADAGKISTNAYTQGIATIALCEAYGMTKDAALLPHAQAAVNFMQKSQGPNGSWGYSPGTNGDTSIVGWQLQALSAAQAAGLEVNANTLKKAVKFLDLAAGGAQKSSFGYQDATGARPGTALTAVGLFSRARIDGWGPDHLGTRDGITGLLKRPPAGKGDVRDMYYYYYATQVLRLSGGDDWKTWNEGREGADEVRKGGMRDWLVAQQVTKEGANLGSWDPEQGWFGSSCGRLGTTAVCLLTLEVYYRCLPPEKAK